MWSISFIKYYMSQWCQCLSDWHVSLHCKRKTFSFVSVQTYILIIYHKSFISFQMTQTWQEHLFFNAKKNKTDLNAYRMNERFFSVLVTFLQPVVWYFCAESYISNLVFRCTKTIATVMMLMTSAQWRRRRRCRCSR